MSRLFKFIDATLGFALCKLIGLLRHVLGRPELAPDPEAAAVRRILFIRPGGLGDMIMALPVLHALHEHLPQAIVDVICESRNRDALRLTPLNGKVFLYDRYPLTLIRQLLTMRYDVVIDSEQFHNSSALMAIASGAPVRIGFKINPARLHLYTHLINYDVNGYERDQFAALLKPLTGNSTVPPLHGLLDGAVLNPLPATLADRCGDHRVVAISPGSRNRYKHWDTPKLVALIETLADQQWIPVLIGSRAEKQQAREIVQHVRCSSLIDCVGDLPLADTAALLRRANLFLGCDSGLAHL
ncbi:MAG: glycosyltransferase family 9 protein, partial [Verrucomicrobia bacterium]|nr:glycosyltransferase family 9 protein [Verrucomicrobiota bacterium]